MKRVFYIAITLIIIGLTSTSCGDKDEDIVVVDLPGTTWSYNYSSSTQQVEETFYFISETTYSFKYNYTGEVVNSDSTSGAYTYSAPNISIDLGGNTIMTGTVEDKAMTLQIGNGLKTVYTKDE